MIDKELLTAFQTIITDFQAYNLERITAGEEPVTAAVQELVDPDSLVIYRITVASVGTVSPESADAHKCDCDS